MRLRSTNTVAPRPPYLHGVGRVPGGLETDGVRALRHVIEHVEPVVVCIAGHHAVAGDQAHPAEIDRLARGNVPLQTRDDAERIRCRTEYCMNELRRA